MNFKNITIFIILITTLAYIDNYNRKKMQEEIKNNEIIVNNKSMNKIFSDKIKHFYSREKKLYSIKEENERKKYIKSFNMEIRGFKLLYKTMTSSSTLGFILDSKVDEEIKGYFEKYPVPYQ